MRVQTKALRYWKTEHKDLNNCQDSYALEASRGLFAVSDGAGTTLFPAIWARIIANHFVQIPLMSKNPFEIEWWVRLAQEEYKTSIPNLSQIQDPFVRQKAQNQGSDSTLATLRISASLHAEAQAELLVFGDSCVIIGNTLTQELKSFVLQDSDQFAQAPICIPSTLKFFNRSFHTCSLTTETLRPEHRVIIASDAVSKWILSAGNNRYQGPTPTWIAFQAIYDLTEQTWPAFIEECRDKHEMVNDDATALILTFFDDISPEGEPIIPTTKHDETTLQIRKAAFDKAYQEQNNELIAIYYGNGADIRPLTPTLTEKEIAHARDVADALKELLRHFRQYQNTPSLAARMQPFWQQYGPILQDEKCAENIRTTLQNNGVNLSLTPIDPIPPTNLASQFKQTPPSYSANPIPTPTSKPAIPPAIPASTPSLNPPTNLYSGPDKTAAEVDFLRACIDFSHMTEEEKKTNFTTLLDTFSTLEKTFNRYQQIYPLKPAHEQYLKQAREYKQAQDNLQKAFHSGYAENIVTAYNPSLINSQSLTPAQLNAIQLSQKLLAAYHSEDDSELLTTFDAMQQFSSTPSLPFSFQFTEEDHKRIQRARQRLNALKIFKTVLETGRLAQIAANYNPILDNSKDISTSNRELLQLAQEFIAANDNAFNLVAIADKIERSPYHRLVAFDSDEVELIHQARITLKKRYDFYLYVLATVKGQEIRVNEVRKVSLVKFIQLTLLIKDLETEIARVIDSPLREKKQQKIQEYQNDLHPNNIFEVALNDLLKNIFIVEEIKNPKTREEFEIYNVTGQLQQQMNYFHQNHFVEYQDFLQRHKLTDDDVRKIIPIFLHYKWYKEYFANHPRLLQEKDLEKWLSKQRKEVSYTNNTFEETVQWLNAKLPWNP